jgi:iron(III) transport system permease protein
VRDPFLFWRLATAALLILFLGLPLSMPFLDLIGDPNAWHVWTEAGRLLELSRNTLLLALGAAGLALPIGTLAAILFYRTDLPGRHLWRFLTILTVFVPLPLFASAWQAALGYGGWLQLGLWNWTAANDPDVSPTGLAWKPWAHGLGAAIWVHAMAGLPWVILIVGRGLGWVERELEEEALTSTGSLRVLWHVTLVRCRGALWAAGLWVALQTATDITVTDTLQVRTFAEEVYTQLVLGDTGALARSVAATVPSLGLMIAMVLGTALLLIRQLPSLETLNRAPVCFHLGGARWPCCAAVVLVVGLLAGVPLASLSWKVGLAGSPTTWSPATAGRFLGTVLRVRGPMVVESFGLGALCGLIAATLALLVAWLARGPRWFPAGALVLLAAAWVLPGPVAGLGLKTTIAKLLDLTDSDRLATVLYYGPSLTPVLWAHLLRLFPYALVILWPVVRLIPIELRETARVDGAGPWQELRHLVIPLCWPAALQAGLAVAVLSLGELSAGKLVETAGAKPFAHEIFEEMHYGVTNNVAALCLVLLAMVITGAVAMALATRLLLRTKVTFLSPLSQHL